MHEHPPHIVVCRYHGMTSADVYSLGYGSSSFFCSLHKYVAVALRSTLSRVRNGPLHNGDTIELAQESNPVTDVKAMTGAPRP